MDHSRFDALARAVGGVRTRRGVVGAVMAAIGGGAVAVAGGLPGTALTPTRAGAHEPSRLDPGPEAWAVMRHYPYVQPPQPIIDAFHNEYIEAACSSGGFHTFYAIDAPWMPPAGSSGKPGDPLGVIITTVIFETKADYEAFAEVEAVWLAGLTGTVLAEPLQEHAGPVALAHHHDPHTCGICGRVCQSAPPAACVPDCAGKTCGGDGCGGSCGACTGASTCDDGVCVCEAPAVTCGGACVDLQTDADHCGACDEACGGGSTCTSGVCLCGGEECDNTCCDGYCVDTSSDAENCGACGEYCTAEEMCSGGTCIVAPPCHGSSFDYCWERLDGTLIETDSDCFTHQANESCSSDADCVTAHPDWTWTVTCTKSYGVFGTGWAFPGCVQILENPTPTCGY